MLDEMPKCDDDLLCPRKFGGTASHREVTATLEPLHPEIVPMYYIRFGTGFRSFLPALVLATPCTCLVPCLEQWVVSYAVGQYQHVRIGSFLPEQTYVKR
jgi:hypothetical protein